MINSKKDYKEYIIEDEKAIYYSKKITFKKYFNPIWKYERILRKHEYYNNCSKNILLRQYYRIKHKRLGIKYGFTIPINTFGKGLSIAHVGTIVVNSGAKIGDYCRIHTCVNIGTEAGKENYAPTVGNGVYIGPGAKIFGNIKLGNNIAIGANAVVNKDFIEDNISIGGIPAKKISNKGSNGFHYNANNK